MSNFHLKIESSILSLGLISLCVSIRIESFLFYYFLSVAIFAFCDVEGAMFDFRLIGAIIRESNQIN